MTGPASSYFSYFSGRSEDQKYVCIYWLTSCGRCPRMSKLILWSMQIHVVTFNRLEGKWFWPPVLVSFWIRWTIPWNILDLLDATMLAYSYLKMSSSHFMSGCRIWGLRLSVDFLKGKCLGLGAADCIITFLSLLNWVSRFRQGMILIRYAKLAVGLHLCRNHFAYSFGLREIFSRHFGLHDPSFFSVPTSLFW